MENYKHDIFISYKHEALDKAVAARLQKSLEHYKIPKEIQKKKHYMQQGVLYMIQMVKCLLKQ